MKSTIIKNLEICPLTHDFCWTLPTLRSLHLSALEGLKSAKESILCFGIPVRETETVEISSFYRIYTVRFLHIQQI